ncbi:MAG: hypothetical protein CND00_04345, partial [Cryomorphaceae bacterium MED-G14]
MKKNILLFLMVMSPLLTFSQSSDAFSYQSVLRDANGNIISSRNVLVDVSILSSQSLVYSESHNTSTSSNGIISLKIGSKNQSSFSNIDWSNNNHSITVKVSLEGSDYYVTTKSDLLSVPYALYAKESADSPQLISSIAKVQADVDQNEADSDAADATLTTDLTAEVTRAKAAEAAIQADVDQNEADSDAADAVLQSNIDGLSNSAVSSLNDLSDVVIDDGPWPSNAGNISYYINGSSMTNTTNKSLGNTAFGDDALSRITDGQQNTGLGTYANLQTSTGSFNTAIGYGTLFANTTGDDNVSVGNNSALRVTSGSSNVAIGSNSLNTTTIGSYNTAIGRSAKASSASANNETILGYLTTGQGTNTVTLGNSSVSAVYMAEDSGATVYAGGLNIGGTAVTSSATELNILDGVTATATELNLIDGVTA